MPQTHESIINLRQNKIKEERLFNNEHPEIRYIQSSNLQSQEFSVLLDEDFQVFNLNLYQGSYIKMYCNDKTLLSKIFNVENEQLREILEISLINIESYLDNSLKENNYSLECYNWTDYEISDWEHIVIEVKSCFDNFEEMDEIWNKLIMIYNESYDSYINRVEMAETKDEKEIENLVRIIVELI